MDIYIYGGIMRIWYDMCQWIYIYTIYASTHLEIIATYACICESDENKKHIYTHFCLLYFPQYVSCDHWGLL